MGRSDFTPGHATVEDFFYWINERHRIYLKRQAGEPWPWTEDPILREFKFTNCFRQLDRGTVHYTNNIAAKLAGMPLSLVFNTITYRMYNRVETQEYLGDLLTWTDKERDRWLSAPSPVFTSAHMTVGRACESKQETYVQSWNYLWENLADLTKALRDSPTMEGAFKALLSYKIFGIGKFIAYEIICDLRFTEIGQHWSDTLTWANIGPGCKRGLMRLGLPVELESLRLLYSMAEDHLIMPVAVHLPWGDCHQTPPFELREIEHSLCEFDKYQRVKTGAGVPRERYRPS